MNKINTSQLILKGIGILFLTVSLLNGCSVIDFDKKPRINEASIESLRIEPVNLPITKLPTASLEQAKESYLTLMQNTDSADLIAESLQRLAEIETMIAENSLAQGSADQMSVHLKLAANYYQQLLTNHPGKITTTKIQYQLASVLELDGQQDSSQVLLSELAQLKGPEFEVIEAGFRMAENAYSRKNYSTALSLYNKVLLHKNDPEKGALNSFYNTALFKRGWTQFKRQQYDLAFEDFVALLHIIYVKPELRKAGEANLIEETFRVSALSLSYLNGAKTLSKTIKKNGHTDFEAELYSALAALYTQQQRFQDTADTYFTFVQSNPLSIDAPEFENKGIEVLSKSGFIDLLLTAKENFVEHYKNDADYWQKTNRSRSETVSTWLFKNLEDVINYHHTEAQQSKQKADYLSAAKWYQIFLISFHDHPKVMDKRWLYAETLNDAGDHARSISEYQILAYQPNILSAEKKEEAGFRIILARQNILDKLIKKQPRETLSIKRARQQLIAAGLAYKTKFLNAKRAPDVIAQTIELQLAEELTMDAVALARTLQNTKWVNKDQQKRAREVIANGEFDLKNYQLAEQAYTLLFKEDQYQLTKMQSFHERRAQAIYKQAEMQRDAKNYDKAIEHFLRLGIVEPKSSIRANAEFDAATLLLQIESFNKAIIVLENFTKNYPKNILTKSIPAKLILAYEALLDWPSAAKQYVQIASSTDDKELARTAIWQAASSWMKMHDKKSQQESVALWKKYIKAYPKPFDLALEASNNLITLYGELKVKWKQDFWRNKIILMVDSNKLLDVRARTLAAQAQLSLTNDVFMDFKSVKLSQPLKKSLNLKRKKLTKSLHGFTKILDYRIQPISTQAGFHIGELYVILAKSILDSERPKGMTKIELEEYDTLLEERVFPVEDQGIEALEANISLTKIGVWDDWIRQSFQQLAILMPGRYNKPEVIDDYATTP